MTRSALRKLLRAVQTHVRTPNDSRSVHFREFVISEFQRNAGLKDAAVIKKKLSLVQDYASLIASVHHHKDLLRSYNIDVDRSAQEELRLQDTAARVGLQMPLIYQEEGGELKEKDGKMH